jgi:hypothetical protein
MANEGWIKLHRQAIDSDVFENPSLWKMFCWCLLKANHKPRSWKGEMIPRGSFATGRASAAEQLGVSESKYRRDQLKLTDMGVISVKATNRFSVIQVENYESFQTLEANPDQRMNQQATKKRPTDEPASEPQTRIEELKNEKKKKAPDGLLALIDGWNSQASAYGLQRCRRDPPAVLLLSRWRSAQRNPQMREALADVPKLLTAISEATFGHGKSWFSLPRLFTKNKAGEIKLLNVLNGDYRNERDRKPSYANSPGTKHDPANPVSTDWD